MIAFVHVTPNDRLRDAQPPVSRGREDAQQHSDAALHVVELLRVGRLLQLPPGLRESQRRPTHRTLMAALLPLTLAAALRRPRFLWWPSWGSAAWPAHAAQPMHCSNSQVAALQPFAHRNGPFASPSASHSGCSRRRRRSPNRDKEV